MMLIKKGYLRLLGGGAQNWGSLCDCCSDPRCQVCCVELFGGFFLPKMIESRPEKFNLMLFFFFLQGMNNK